MRLQVDFSMKTIKVN